MNRGQADKSLGKRLLRGARAHASTLVGLAVMLLVAASFWLPQCATLRGPLVGEHDWRQADTYSIAYNYAHVSPNFFFPRIDMTNGRSGVQGTETPLYPYLLSLLMRIFGDAPAVGRTFTMLLGLFGMIQAAIWFRPRGTRMWLTWPVALLVSPMYLYELRQIQPDPAMAAFAAISASQLVAFRRTGRTRHFAFGWIFALAMALTKAPGVILLPVMWTFAWPETWPRSLGQWARVFATGFALATPAALSFAWYRWGQHLNATFNEGEVYFAAEFSLPAIQADLANHGNLVRFFLGVVNGYVVHWALLPVALVGFVLSFRPAHVRTSLSMVLWLSAWTFFCAGFSTKLWWHWYYATPMVVPVAYFVAIALYEAGRAVFSSPEKPDAHGFCALVALAASFWLIAFVGGAPADAHHTVGAGGDVLAAQGSSWGWLTPINIWVLLATLAVAAGMAHVTRLVRLRHVVALVAIIGIAAGFSRFRTDALNVLTWRARTDLWGHYARSVPALRAAENHFSTRDDVFVVDFGENPAGLQRANRRGFVEPPDRLDARGAEYYRSRGARFFVHFVEGERRPRIAESMKMLASGEGWELYCMDAAGCAPLRPR